MPRKNPGISYKSPEGSSWVTEEKSRKML